MKKNLILNTDQALSDGPPELTVMNYTGEAVWKGTYAEYGALLHMLRTLSVEPLYRLHNPWPSAPNPWESEIENMVSDHVLVRVWPEKATNEVS